MANRGPIHLARIAGVDLTLHWTWFLVLLYEVESRKGIYGSLAWNVLEVLALFAIVTLHEFGHALACRQVGGIANRILLWPFGGIAFAEPPPRPGATLWTIAAGPLVNVALIPVLAMLPALATTADAATFVASLRYINAGLLVFNLIPVYPLDGGQILHALLWYPLGRPRSLMVTTVLGLVGVAGLLFVALRAGDLWLAAIGVFILLYCWNGLKRARSMWQMAKLARHHGFACPWCQVAPPAAELWRCGQCQAALDPFAGDGACPVCRQPLHQVPCVDCGHVYPWAAWVAAPTVLESGHSMLTSAPAQARRTP